MAKISHYSSEPSWRRMTKTTHPGRRTPLFGRKRRFLLN
jgi:hypothetical protein